MACVNGRGLTEVLEFSGFLLVQNGCSCRRKHKKLISVYPEMFGMGLADLLQVCCLGLYSYFLFFLWDLSHWGAFSSVQILKRHASYLACRFSDHIKKRNPESKRWRLWTELYTQCPSMQCRYSQQSLDSASYRSNWGSWSCVCWSAWKIRAGQIRGLKRRCITLIMYRKRKWLHPTVQLSTSSQMALWVM